MSKSKIVKLSFLVFLVLFSSNAFAATGGDIFKNAACNLLKQVLTKDYGALMTVLAGLFAILSAIVGSFRQAWVLVFVSVGIYIYPTIVGKFFPSLGCGE